MKKFLLPLILLLSCHHVVKPVEPVTIATTFALSNLLPSFSIPTWTLLVGGMSYLYQPADAGSAFDFSCNGISSDSYHCMGTSSDKMDRECEGYSECDSDGRMKSCQGKLTVRTQDDKLHVCSGASTVAKDIKHGGRDTVDCTGYWDDEVGKTVRRIVSHRYPVSQQ